MSSDRIARLRVLLDSDPTDAFTRYALALEYAGQGDVMTALELLNAVRVSHPTYVAAYHQLGILHERQGDTKQAEAVYTEGIARARSLGDNHAAAEMQEALDLIS